MHFCRKATYAFARLLDVRKDPAFQCPVCRHLPHGEMCVLLDGICLGFQRAHRLPPDRPTVDTDRVVETL